MDHDQIDFTPSVRLDFNPVAAIQIVWNRMSESAQMCPLV